MKMVKIFRNKYILTNEVVLLKAEINYTELHFENGQVITLSKTLKRLHDDFSEHGFFRISKKNMINIKYLSKVFQNYSMVKLKNKVELNVSRRRREDLRTFIYAENNFHKMKLKILLISCLLIGQQALAQFDKLKEKVKKELPSKPREVPSREDGSQNGVPNVTDKDKERNGRLNAHTKSKEDAKYKSGELDRKTKLNSPEFDRKAYEERVYATFDPDFAAESFAPAVAWYSLLDQDCLNFNITKGELRMHNLYVSFLPKRTKDGKEINYNPSLSMDMHPPIRADIVEAGTGILKGQQFFKADDYIEPFKKLVLVEEYGGDFFPFWATLKEGSYEVKFYVGKAQFYTFPFKVEKKTNPDAYAVVKDLYFFRGPWEEWGRIEFEEADGEMLASIYFTEQNLNIKSLSHWNDTKPLALQTKITRDGKLVATYGLPGWGDVSVNNGQWTRIQTQTFKAGTKTVFTKADLKDGNYAMDCVVKDPKTSKTTNLKYGFVVRGGAIQPAQKADRNLNKDPTTLLEQGKELFYIKRL